MVCPQYTPDQRNYLFIEYGKRKGTRDFFPNLIQDFLTKFPNARRPNKQTIRDIFKKQSVHGTVHNLNSQHSPGNKMF